MRKVFACFLQAVLGMIVSSILCELEVKPADLNEFNFAWDLSPHFGTEVGTFAFTLLRLNTYK